MTNAELLQAYSDALATVSEARIKAAGGPHIIWSKLLDTCIHLERERDELAKLVYGGIFADPEKK